ncbi:hypothetical protein F4778DRAFT_456092 [Xylariomycetidae sp. FL2044]|nr:hypothetical protein F4778DRAFT_456092 [Xylariomycetidae sp. FL2044]
MAPKTTFIPRFLLPQYGPLWRTTAARPTALARPLHPEVGQILVRYASKTATPKAASTTTARTTAAKAKAAAKVTTPKAATETVAAPKAASTKTAAARAAKTATKVTAPKAATEKVAAPKAASTKSSSASKASKASAPTKLPPKSTSTKTPAAKAAAPTKATATTKTPTSQSVPKPAAAKAPAPAAAAPTTRPEIPAATAAADADAAPKASTPTPPPPSSAKPAAKAPAAAATTDPSKPIVLEKPERFNPPSHGSRLPRSIPKHYGGGPTAEEVQAQSAKSYPGLPPPPNTWAHWFINSRGIHLFITLGTLSSLAIYTFAANFQEKSRFADMIPPISELPRHPIQYIGVCIDVLKLHEEHESAVTAEKRRRKVEDVAKRNEYRKAHGLEPAQGFWAAGQVAAAPQPESKEEEELTDQPPSAAAAVAAADAAVAETPEVAAAFTPEGKRKKFLGIF